MKYNYLLKIIKSPFVHVILTLSIITVVGILLVYFINGKNPDEIAFLVYIATAAIAIVAYFEIRQANELKTNELLTFISNRWGSFEIIKARQIIQTIFAKYYRYDKQGNLIESKSNDFNMAVINSAIEIDEMCKYKDKKGRDFVYILNLLDYLESISSFYVRDQIKIEDVSIILGNNVLFYYNILKKYIERRQSRHQSDFINFQTMYYMLEHRKNIKHNYNSSN